MNNLLVFRKLIGQFRHLFVLRNVLNFPIASCCVLCGQDSQTACCHHCERDFIPWTDFAAKVPDSAHHSAIDEILAAYVFAYPLNHLVHALKYQQNLAIAKWFAGHLECLITQETVTIPIDVVIGMPLHPKRLQVRGFNQSHEIARHLASALQIPCQTECCFRRHHLRPQVELTLSERNQLPLDLFDCQADLESKHVLLVDDVLTTGASLDRLAHAVKRQGATRVTACVVARVP